MKIYLLGFMGAGKSYIGKRLAKRLNYTFCDLDDLIEQQNNASINEIFTNQGEKSFRQLERTALQSTARMHDTIIACGGGTPCFFDNIKVINQLGKSIFIDVSPQQIVKNLKGETDKRPLVNTLSVEKLLPFVQQKLQQRLPYYRQASYIFNPENEHLAADVALENWVHFTKGWS